MTKKQYSQPEIQVASIALESIILAGSGDVDPNALGFKNIDTNEVW